MKKVFLLFIIFNLTVLVTAQISDTTLNIKPVSHLRTHQGNSLYLEICGNAMLVSINYERLVVQSNRFYLTGRVGLGIGTYIRRMSSQDFLSMPLLLNFQYQLSNVVLLEFGAGSTLSFVPSHQYFNPLITGVIGMRAQSKSGFLFRVGFTPLVSLDKDLISGEFETFFPWVGISLGYSFGK
jgi:hypothetical protein